VRGAKALVCPQCKTRYDELPPPPNASGGAAPVPRVCPRDNAVLVRVADVVQSSGDPMLGRTLDGRFTILAKLGAGSMGTVYRARQHAMGRDVAIKILRGDKAVDDQSKGRFLREARANSLLASPHTVTVFDFGQAASGELFLAMELLEGESVGQRIQRLTRIPLDLAVETCRQALRSLGEAHAKGIIHRDLKPDNLFYAKVVGGGPNEELVKVLDFGIAKVLGDTKDPMNAVETQAGTVFGTPRYMSPEQAQGKPLDGRSDLYALGVILYHMLTGRPPFTDDDAIVVMARHIKTPPPSFATAAPDLSLPPDLEALVMRLLAKDPKGRPATTEALVAELARLSDSNMSITSGVRVSVSTAPPFKLPESAESLSVPTATPSLETLELAGMPRRKTSLAMIAIVALAASGAAAFGARELLEARRGAEPSAPAIAATATAVASTAEAPVPSDLPAIPPPETATVDPNQAAIPSVPAEALPKAPLLNVPGASVPGSSGRHGTHSQGGRPASNASNGTSGPAARPTAAPTASHGYGLLE
jgi:eukaryotic-like serine/threonine-protein kinase